MHHCAVCAIAPDSEVRRRVMAGQFQLNCFGAVCDGQGAAVAAALVPLHRRRVRPVASKPDIGKVQGVGSAEISDDTVKLIAGFQDQLGGCL